MVDFVQVSTAPLLIIVLWAYAFFYFLFFYHNHLLCYCYGIERKAQKPKQKYSVGGECIGRSPKPGTLK